MCLVFLIPSAQWLMARASQKPLSGAITVFQESPYWSVYHFEKEQVTREIRAIAYNRTGKTASYFILVKNGSQTLKKIDAGSTEKSPYKKDLLVPLFHNEQVIELYAEQEGKETLLSKKKLSEEPFLARFETMTEPQADPVALGHFLVPRDVLLLTKDTKLTFVFHLLWLGNEKKKVSLEVSPSVLRGLPFHKEVSLRPGALKKVFLEFDLQDAVSGTFRMRFQASPEEQGAGAKVFERTVILEKPADKRPPLFSSARTSLRYDFPVQTHTTQDEYQNVSWEEAWKNGPHEDVVVNFPQGFRYVFWRGASYVPLLSFGNVALTYEWVEAQGEWGRPPGQVRDCVEPLQDKECRFSSVRIVSSNPARITVQWKYKLIDLDYKDPEGERAVETYTFYPNGFGVRYVQAWLVPNAWHEESEFIVVMPAGSNPFEVIEDRGITLLSPDGAKQEMVYPKPDFKWEMGKPTIFRVHLKNVSWTPIMVSAGWENKSVFDGWMSGKRYVSPSYWGDHWPVTRGFLTRQGEPPAFYQSRPTHASLMSTYHKPLRVIPSNPPLVKGGTGGIKEKREWAWLIGAANISDVELTSRARNWLFPPKWKLKTGASVITYAQERRAYQVQIKGKQKKVEIKLSGNETLYEPAFELTFPLGAQPWKKVVVKINGKKLFPDQYASGLEETAQGSVRVVFMKEQLLPGTTVSFIRQTSP